MNRIYGQIDWDISPLLIEIFEKTPWIKIDEPDDLLGRLPQVGERFQLYRAGFFAFQKLCTTAEGNEYLLDYHRKHPEVHLKYFYYDMSQHYSLFSDKLDRKFWNFATQHLHNYYYEYSGWAVRLPIEKRIELADIWLNWLKQINPKEIIPNESNFSTSLLKTVSYTLYDIFDPRIILAYHDLLGIVPKNYFDYSVFWNLYKMGDPSSFLLFSRFSKSDLSPGLLAIANEKQAIEYLKIAKSVPDQYSNKYLDTIMLRPDLQRGIIRYLLDDPAYESLLGRIMRSGSVTLKDEELLQQIVSTKENKYPYLRLEWIILLGDRDSTIGNSTLFKFVQGETAKTSIGYSAAKALGTRLLGKNRASILNYLKSLPEKEKAIIVHRILAAMGFAQIDSPDMHVSQHDTIPTFSWQHKEKKDAWNELFYKRYKKELLDLLQYAPQSVDLSVLYAMIDSAEAQQYFISFIKKGSPQAIELAWTYRMYPGINILKEILPAIKDKEPSFTFLLLMLSESGDKEAYELLKNRFYFQPLDDQKIRFYDSIIEESVRRKDLATLFQQVNFHYSKIVPANNWINLYFRYYQEDDYKNYTNWYQYSIKELVHITHILSELAKSNIDETQKIINSMKIDKEIHQIIIIGSCIEAKNKKCEPLLRLIESEFKNYKNNTPRDSSAYMIWRLWIKALQETNTEWCRDQVIRAAPLLLDEVIGILVKMGDARAISLSRKIHKNSFFNWTDALALGDIQQVSTEFSRNELEPWNRVNCFRYTRVQSLFTSKPEMRIDSKNWSADQVNYAVKQLMNQFPKLSPEIRLCFVQALGSSKELWTDQLVRMSLHDNYAPVRLAMLQILLLFPKQNFISEIKNIYSQDPVPWCRRLAYEILILKPDPFRPHEGILFLF